METQAATQASGPPAISVRNLSLSFGARVLLENTSFDVRRGEIVVLLGGSGSGKSSLMKTVIGLHRPSSGDVLINGESLFNASTADKIRLQRTLGVMYQGGALFGSMNVLANVRFPLDRFTELSLEQKNLVVRMLLHELEMDGTESLMPAELSGGMIKRVGIARAMALGCDILLLDEPSAGLDPVTAADLDRAILALRKEFAVTFLIVSHDLQSIFTIADRAIMLDAHARGVIADGAPALLRDRSSDARVHRFFNREPNSLQAGGGLPASAEH